MVGKYQPYPAYKDSGVDWLGEIPKAWGHVPVGRVFKRIKRTGYIEEELLSVYRDYGVIPKSSRDDNNNKPSEDLNPYQLVNIDDLVMNKMKAWQGSIATSEYRGIVSPAYFVYQPQLSFPEYCTAKFVHYLLRSPRYIAQYLRRSKGIRVNQWDLDPMEFQKIEILLPSKPEQTQIANFLDHETAKIDTLIAKQEKLIELLQEKRQAVISHAVTKGLDSDVPMKDSGVEWLGEVPAHWGVSKLKYECSNIIDCLHSTPEYIDDGVRPAIRTADVFPGKLKVDSARKVSLKTYEERNLRLIPKPGDIIYTREGERFGLAALIPNGKYICLGQRVMLFRTKETPGYLMWALNASSTYKQAQVDVIGSTSPHVNVETIKNFVVAWPPEKERLIIESFIKRSVVKLDQIHNVAIAKINLLQERRTALISAAVTGKIDVRNWEPNKTQDA